MRKETFICNATKYLGAKEHGAEHKKLLARYNGARPLARGYRVQESDAWCATYVSSVALESGATAQDFPMECSCYYMSKRAKELGLEISARYLDVGDCVIYDWGNDGTLDHVGIVVQRTGTTLKVIEGNKSNAVGYRTVGVNSKNIRFCFRPTFKEEPYEGTTSSGDNVDELATRVINGEFGTGDVRRKLLGDKYDVVQQRVNEMLSGKPQSSNLDDIARRVIRGEFGNGASRRQAVRNAGYDYTAVQRRVNEMLKTGR